MTDRATDERQRAVPIGNGSGRWLPDMEAFDRLPAEVREVLRYAPRNFAPATVDASLKRKCGRSNKVGLFVAHMKATLNRRFPGRIRQEDMRPGARRRVCR